MAQFPNIPSFLSNMTHNFVSNVKNTEIISIDKRENEYSVLTVESEQTESQILFVSPQMISHVSSPFKAKQLNNETVNYASTVPLVVTAILAIHERSVKKRSGCY